MKACVFRMDRSASYYNAVRISVVRTKWVQSGWQETSFAVRVIHGVQFPLILKGYNKEVQVEVFSKYT